MEDPTDDDNLITDEIVVGKTSGSGIKITYVTFNYTDILDLQNDTNNVWIYESNIFLKLKNDSNGDDPFISQRTEIHPLEVEYTSLNTTTGITSLTGISNKTGEFPIRNKVPSVDKTVVATYTDTVHTYVSPSGAEFNQENYGIVLISQYTNDTIDENTDARDVRYYGSGADEEEYIPYIDICYKVVEIEHCEEGETEIIIPTADDVVIVENKPGKNFDEEDLTVGTDLDDTTTRTLIKFNSEAFDEDKYTIDSITKAWVYITFNDFTEGAEDERTSQTINIKTITEEWFENNATWNTASDISSDDILSTIEIPVNQPGKTQIVVPIENATSVQDILKDTYGIMLVNDDESTSTRVPEFINKDTTGSYDKPSLHVCVPITTSSTTTPSTSSSTTTPSTSSSTTTPSTSSSTTTPTTTPTTYYQPHECSKPSGGTRVEIKVTHNTVVLMEDPTDDDNLITDEIVVGKTSGSGIKITYVIFNYTDILDLQNDTNNVWIYESNIFLKLKNDSNGDDPFIPQRTEIHPLEVEYTSLKTTSNITSQTGISDTTGEFPIRNKVSSVEKTVVATYTDTIHTYVSPSGAEFNQENYGIVLISQYTNDTIDEDTDARDVRYYGSGADKEEYIPYIDICYKVVEIKHCEEDETEILITTADDVVIVEGKPDKNFDEKDLTVGTDIHDRTTRTLIKFNSESFDDEKYDIDSITEAWIYITFNDFTEGTEDERTSQTINIKTITEEWFENNATWNTAVNITSADIISTLEIPENQPGKTQIVVPIEISVKELLEDTYGIMLVNDDEGTSTRVPKFINKDTTGSYDKPSLHVCVPTTLTTTTTPTPSESVTPTYTTSSPVTTTTIAPPLQNCTIPTGGKRVTIDLTDYIEIQDEPLSANVNEQYVKIGKTDDEGEKVLIMYFNMEQAIEDAIGTTDNVAVTDSRINFRLREPTDENDDDWVSGRPILYPLKSEYDDNSTWSFPWLLEDGPTEGVDYYSSLYAQFPKLKKIPDNTRWLQAVTTTLVRYIFTETTYAKSNNGYVLKYVTEDGSDAKHFLTFDSPLYDDDEFHPYMDICYLEVEPPITCEEGTLIYYEINADSYIIKDNLIHGSEEYLLVGNSGWDGNARILIDFDMSTVSDLVELYDDTESVYLRLWYEGAEMGKPYNDPRQMDRTLAAHKITKSWSEDSATNKIATSSGSKKNTWGAEMMDDLTDYMSDVEDSDTIEEGEGQNNFYLNLTEVFLEWKNYTSSDYGVVIKDNWHESVPGYFLKFASNDNSDPTKRPYLMVCQKEATCEPVDDDPVQIVDEDDCVSVSNVTLNTCVAKNGGCEMTDTADNYDGYYYGVTALWNTYHELVTFCKCCIELTSEKQIIPMDCSDVDGKSDYDNESVTMITSCGCQQCEEVSRARKKRAAPSKTRLLLRSALKSMLRK